MGCVKGEGGSSNVDIVLKGGHQNVHVRSQGGGGSVKIVPNPVHVVCERPLREMKIQYIFEEKNYILRNI